MKFIERGLDKATTLEELPNCLDRDSRQSQQKRKCEKNHEAFRELE